LSFYTLGISDDDLEKFRHVYKNLQEYKNHILQTKSSADHIHCLNKVCIDVANGYSEKFNDFIKRFKTEFPELVIMAGNVVTGEMTEELILSGADIVKVGIGPGSVCTTRKMTGVGYPQLSAIIECSDSAHGLNALICGDGGITNSGDVAKAFGAGADFIMCGGLFAGHQECEGEIEGLKRTIRKDVKTEVRENIMHDEKEAAFWYRKPDGSIRSVVVHQPDSIFKNESNPSNKLPDDFYDIEIPENPKIKFYGMSSEEAMNKYYNGKANYRASEGKVVYVDYKGPVESTIIEVLGGLRSACTYTGAKSLKQLSKCTTFIRVSQQLNEFFGKS
jgi:GMP reductase